MWGAVGMAGALAACAKGGLAENNSASTFGSGSPTSATATMTASDPSDSATTDSETDSDTDGETGTAVSTAASASDTESATEDASEVGGELCGNGMVDGAEQCDGADLGGTDCIGAGLVGGTLACSVMCTFDTSACVDAACGDGMLQAGETCDCGMAGSPCTPAQLANQSCNALPAPSGGNYSGGTLACTPQCGFDENGCTACGDGVIDAGEACDGGDLGGQSCASQGFDAGSLSCAGSCTFNTGGCVNYVCGNGICDPGEDSCSCPGDCPDDPNTCGDPCQCGGSGGNCYCDLACLDFGDCCVNGPC